MLTHDWTNGNLHFMMVMFRNTESGSAYVSVHLHPAHA